MQNENTHDFPVSWEQIDRDAIRLAHKLKEIKKFDTILAVCRGGLVPAALIARELDIHIIDTLCFDNSKNSEQALKLSPIKEGNILILDDIINTGKTAKIVRELYPDAHYASLYVKEEVKHMVDTYITAVSQNTWFKFPWEHENK